MKLEGRNALITGSGRNLGAAVAAAYGREGANIVVNVRSSIAKASTPSKLDRPVTLGMTQSVAVFE